MVNPPPSPSHINAGQFKSELSISDDEDEGQDHRRRSHDPIANVLDPYVKGNQTENKDVRRIGPGMELSTISDQDGEMKASRIMINYGVCKVSMHIYNKTRIPSRNISSAVVGRRCCGAPHSHCIHVTAASHQHFCTHLAKLSRTSRVRIKERRSCRRWIAGVNVSSYCSKI